MKATGVTGQCTVRPNNTVAGDDDGDRVAAICTANRTNCFGVSNSGSDIAITPRFAVGDFKQGLPYALLKNRAIRCYIQRKGAACVGEVLFELFDTLAKS